MNKKQKIKQLVEMLKFALLSEDDDILRSTIESVIETLEELSI